MNGKVLINLLSSYNYHNILATLKLVPEEVVFIRKLSSKEKEAFDETRKIIESRLPEAKVTEIVMKTDAEDELRRILQDYDTGNTYVNVSGGSRVLGLMALKVCIENEMKAVCIDMANCRLLSLIGNMPETQDGEIDLSVDELISASGAIIKNNSSDFFERHDFIQLLDYMIDNYGAWKLIKQVLRNNSRVSCDELNPLFIVINTTGITMRESEALKQFLAELERLELIYSSEYRERTIKFIFSERESKSFIMMAGSWLEALTYKTIKGIIDVEDAKSGMLFIWDDDSEKVQNELDVVAAYNSKLVCISCKDTDAYDIEQLNELEVYSQRLGGESAVKILVSTEKPKRKDMIYQRAEEMGIHLVEFSGKVETLRDKLREILKQ